MIPDKIIAIVFPGLQWYDICRIQDDVSSNKTRVVDRRQAQQFIFEHLMKGCACISTRTEVNGTAVVDITIWSVKKEEEANHA